MKTKYKTNWFWFSALTLKRKFNISRLLASNYFEMLNIVTWSASTRPDLGQYLPVHYKIVYLWALWHIQTYVGHSWLHKRPKTVWILLFLRLFFFLLFFRGVWSFQNVCLCILINYSINLKNGRLHIDEWVFFFRARTIYSFVDSFHYLLYREIKLSLLKQHTFFAY